MVLDEAKIGDILLFANGERSVLNLIIRHVQKHCLLDLGASDQDARTFCRFTHAGVYYEEKGVPMVVHAYAPRCQVWSLEKKFVGREILVLRPKESNVAIDRRLEIEMLLDVARGRPYSVRDLFFFYLRFYWKVRMGKHFSDVFRDKHADFCSATVVRWYRDSGLDLYSGQMVESVYPARMAYDRERAFVQISLGLNRKDG